MYLVDTSVWTDYINGKEAEHVSFLDQVLSNPLAFELNGLIYMEILQGTKTQKAFEQFQRYFSGQQFNSFQHTEKSYSTATKIYFDCRRSGITIRSSVDCLLAQCAIENELILCNGSNP